jgi:hypothetical protein
LQLVAVCCCNKLHTALRDGARCCALGLCADFINHNHLGHVIFDSLNHDAVLLLRIGHLQQLTAAAAAG